MNALRDALAPNLGKVLTPEVAVEIMQQFARNMVGGIQTYDVEPLHHGEYVYQLERLEYILDELHELHQAHWLETEMHRHGIPFKPDYERIIDQERNGRFMQFTARHNDVLVGQTGMYISTSTHTKQTIAKEDSLFVQNGHRIGVGRRLIIYARDSLFQLGVTEITVTAKLVNSTGKLLTRLGFQHTADEYTLVREQKDVFA